MIPAFVVARQTKSVFSADPRDLAWSSQYNNFKIAAQGATTVTIALNQLIGTKTIVHGLGYIPAFLVFKASQFGGGARDLANYFSLSPETDMTGVTAYANTSNLVIYAERDVLATSYPGAVTYDIYYYLFIDQAA